MIHSLRVSGDQPRAILLDLDDTIVTDDAVSEKTWREVCRRFAPCVGESSADALYTGIRSVAESYWRDHENHRKGRLNLKATRRELVRLALRKMGLTTMMYSPTKSLILIPRRRNWRPHRYLVPSKRYLISKKMVYV